MLCAAKSLRLALRRASVVKTASDRKPDGSSASSENQRIENERDAALLYDKLRHVLERPRFAHVSGNVRVRVLERLAREAFPPCSVETLQLSALCEQSTMESERSLTYCEDNGEQPESMQSETDVDDLVSLAHVVSSTEAKLHHEDLNPAIDSDNVEFDQQTSPCGFKPPMETWSLCSVSSDVEAQGQGEEARLTNQYEKDQDTLLLVAQRRSPTNTATKSVVVSLPTLVDNTRSDRDDLSAAIAALRTVPFLEACTDVQLMEIIRFEDCTPKVLPIGDEIVLQKDDIVAFVAVLTGTVSVWNLLSHHLDRGSQSLPQREIVETLSAPTHQWVNGDRSDGGGVQLVIRAESAATILNISRTAICERLADIATHLNGFVPRSTGETKTLRRHLSDFVETLRDNAPESLEFDASDMGEDITLRRVGRAMRDHLGVCDVALFVINTQTENMTRLRVANGVATIVYDLPVRGLAGLSSRGSQPISVYHPTVDPRFDSMIDIASTSCLVTRPVYIKSAYDNVCVFQFATTDSYPSSTWDSRLLERVAEHLYSISVSRRIRNKVIQSTTAADLLTVIISSLCVPISALPSQSISTTLFAMVSMKLYHGRDELFPATSIGSARTTVEEVEGCVRFEFLEKLRAPEGCSLARLPRATRVVMEMSINQSIALGTLLNRRSSIFSSFSIPTSLQIKDTSRSSTSMSQSFTDTEGNPIPSPAPSITTGKSGRESVLNGWSGFFLYGSSGTLTTGEISLKLWIKSKNTGIPIRQSGLENPDSLCVLQLDLSPDVEPNSVTLTQASSTSKQIVDDMCCRTPRHHEQPDATALASLKKRLLSDPLYEPTPGEKAQLWGLQRDQPFDMRLLPGLLRCVDWMNPLPVTEIYQLLDNVDVLEPPELALRLLGPRYPDPRVRAFAVRSLENFVQPDDAGIYILQLVHALQHERFHDSPLARFLLQKAIQFPHTLGHQLYWLLKANMHQVDLRERYGTLLDLFVTHIPVSERINLRCQAHVVKQLEEIHKKVSQFDAMEDKQAELVKALESMDLPSEFILPVDSTKRMCGISISECRVIGSKKKPLYLVFRVVESVDSKTSSPPQHPTFHVLYKSGDDLRQDQLVLQLFRVMNRMWSSSLKDPMQLLSYGCVSTGPNQGMIEVVRDAETVASIFSQKAQREYGSQRGSTQHKLQSALSVLTEQDALTEWLMLHSLPPSSLSRQKTFQKLHRTSLSGIQSPKQNHSLQRDLVIERLRTSNLDRLCYEDAVRNFARSCAASCIASYVLGIGDRHNDNIMITRHGCFFHIDFGHILGNFKKKFGVKRERTMFVFTPAFAAVLMSESDPKSAQDGHMTLSPSAATLDSALKERETSFLKHLKHTGHSKSCHLEPLAAMGDLRQKNADHNASATIPADALATRRQKWQRSNHASLRLSKPVIVTGQDGSFTQSNHLAQHSMRVPAYELFTQLCCDGYNVVRHHADMLLDLCMLMTGGSLPELQDESDLEWLRTQLMLDVTDHTASDHFLKLIKHSVISRTTLLNDAAHMLKHG